MLEDGVSEAMRRINASIPNAAWNNPMADAVAKICNPLWDNPALSSLISKASISFPLDVVGERINAAFLKNPALSLAAALPSYSYLDAISKLPEFDGLAKAQASVGRLFGSTYSPNLSFVSGLAPVPQFTALLREAQEPRISEPDKPPHSRASTLPLVSATCTDYFKGLLQVVADAPLEEIESLLDASHGAHQEAESMDSEPFQRNLLYYLERTDKAVSQKYKAKIQAWVVKQGGEFSQSVPTAAGLIAQGEGSFLEFKCGAFHNPKTKQRDSSMLTTVVTAVAAFLNSYKGGTVILGVADKPVRIVGISDDLASGNFALQEHPEDAYALAISQAIQNRLGGHLSGFIDIYFESAENNQVCCIVVQPASSPAWLDDELYTRGAQGKRKLRTREAVEFIKQRFS